MTITVREALSLKALEKAVLLAGEAGLDRVISSVNMMEVPEIKRFVKQNEFLVTTTYPIKDDPVAQARLIDDLVSQGLAALAIKPVWYNWEVPEVMVQQAQRLAFPLIQLPNDASFNEIINPILAEILNRQAAILRRNEEVHRSLTNTVLTGGQLSDVAAMLSSWVHGPVSIHGATLRLLAYSDPAVRPLAADADALRKLIRGRSGPLWTAEHGQGSRVQVHPVTVAGEDYAFLLVWQLGSEPIRCEPTTVEQAGLVVALEISKQRAVAEVERRFQVNMIEDLVQGRVDSRAAALARGELFGWDLAGSFVPVLMQANLAPSPTPSIENHRELARVMREIRGVAQAVVAAHAAGSIVIDMGSRILVLIRQRPGTDRSQARRVALEVSQHIIRGVAGSSGVSVSAGAGRLVENIVHLGSGYRQAVRALEIGAMTGGVGTAIHFDDLGVYRILAEYGNRQELEHFCQDILARLVHEPELLHTLEAILDANGNRKEAARALFVHYNTLRYRVHRIESLTGLSLARAEDRLSLQMAVKVLRMNQGAAARAGG